MPRRGRYERHARARELDPVATGLIRANLTGDKFTTDRILSRAFEADLDGLLLCLGGGLEVDLAPGERMGPDVYGDTE